MALGDPTTSFLDDWYAAMMQQPASMPMGEPAPVAPPPQQIATTETAPQAAAVQVPPPAPAPEQPAPMMPGFDSIMDPSAWGGGTESLSTPDLAPVGSGLDQYGFEKDTAVVPDGPTLPGMDDANILNPMGWESEAAPVGSIRTGVAPGEVGMSLEERQALKTSNPLAYEKLKIDETEDEAAKVRAGMAQIARRDAEDAELSLRNFRESQRRSQEMMKQVELDVAALANEKPKKYEPGAMDLIAGIMGMLGANATGGKNVGLELVNQRIERHIQEQRDEYARKAGNVDRKMNLIAKLRDAGYDDYQAGEVIRLSSLERAKQMLMTDIQEYDSQGTTARRKMDQYERLVGEQAKAAEAFRTKQLDEDIKRGEYFIKARKADDEHAAAQRKLAGGGGGQKFSPEYFKALYPSAKVPPIPMSEKEYKNWLGTSKLGNDLTKSEQEVTAGKSQGMSKEEAERGVAGLKQADGSPFIAQGTPEQVGELRKRAAATRTVVRILDQIDRTRTGWSPDVTKSAEWKKLKTDWAAAKGVAKDVLGLGALSGPDEALIENYLSGGLDPTGMRDPGPGLERARMNMLNMTRDSLEQSGLTGGYDIPKPKLSAAEETPSDHRFKVAQEPATLTKVIEADGGAKVGSERKETTEELLSRYVAPGVEPNLENVVLPQVRREITALKAAAKGGDPESLEKLSKLLEVGGNDGVRNAAQTALFEIGRETESYEEASGRSSAVVRDTAPPLRSE